jgi:diguanylate cyclase (GGDEF)-like protein/PAS domain S-box-containing protein
MVIAWFTVCVVLITLSFSAQANNTKRILVLNSYHQGYRWSDAIMEGIRSEFRNTGFKVELWYEYMDTLRYAPETIVPYLEKLYQVKFHRHQFDVIIVSDNNAFEFLLSHRGALFPDVPIVFAGINNFDESMIRRHTAITGVTEEVDIMSTVETIFDLHPHTKTIAVIGDATSTNEAYLNELHTIVHSLHEGVNILELSYSTMGELKEKLRNLTEFDVILCLSVNKDQTGAFLSVDDKLALIADHSNVPVYTLWGNYIGLGPLGGVVTSGELQGRHAVRMAARLLHGESAEMIKVIRVSPNTPMFDYAQMQRFGISRSALPEGSVLVNEPQTLYYRYQTLIWVTVTFVILQSMIIIMLAANTKWRKKAESALRESTKKYLRLFNGAEVPILEQDFAHVIARLQQLREEGITDLKLYLQKNTAVVTKFVNGIKISDANESALRLFRAHSKRELLSNVDAILRPLPTEVYIDKICAIWARKKAFRAECSLNTVEGKELSVVLSMPVPGESEASTRVPVSVFDITDRKRIEMSLHKLSSAVEQSGSAVMITDKKGVIEYVNPRFTEVTGYTAREIIGQTTPILQNLNNSRGEQQELSEVVLSGQDWHGEIHDRRKDGKSYWALTSISPILDECGSITHFVAVSEDVTQLKDTQMRMEQLAFYDTLTGLENRRLFKKRLEQAVKAAQRTGKSVALLYLDLDQFKRINDTLGHDAGDALLTKVAEGLRVCVRREDTAARIGGDEFTVLLPDVGSAAGASIVAQNILRFLRSPVKLAAQEVIVTASIGITLAPNDSVDAEALMKYADLAMYQAKEKGRNNYQFFTEEMNLAVSERLFLENELRRALEQDQFTLYYQPLISLRDQHIVSLEALMRWEHPQLGTLSPERFIKVAEDSGLIVPIGNGVLRKACHQAKILHARGVPTTKMAFNLSARQFHEPTLLSIIKEILTDTDLKGNWLGLELTESVFLETTEQTKQVMRQLRALGLSISIDDFGTGYSSLSFLKRFPIDTIKIDRSFVRDIPRNPNDAEITTAIIAMAHKLHLKVVAEGVETPEQLAFLAEHQADYVQGYLFSKPLPFHQMSELLRKGIQALQFKFRNSNEPYPLH